MIDTKRIRHNVSIGKVLQQQKVILLLCGEIDRLRDDITRLHMENASLGSFVKAGAVSVPQPQGKTVQVRIPVVVDEFKNWSAAGWNGATDDEMKDGLFDAMEGIAVLHWLSGNIPVPEETTIKATVNEAPAHACPLNNAKCREAACYRFDDCEVRKCAL